MKALILNSGLGHRMGALTSEQPKCMTEISPRETILSRQLRLLEEAGIEETVITTGYYDRVLMDYCRSLRTGLELTFVRNPRYAETNYIYSIYCAREHLRGQEILLMHGDLVFEPSVLEDILASEGSCMKVSS
ncbi:MAG: NTP transferase domain-containing protein, partial [Oscillospiraceae bacterium]|nr:NTP transferase domain-containing protein [Oscillospiraceae bacterium]